MGIYQARHYGFARQIHGFCARRNGNIRAHRRDAVIGDYDSAIFNHAAIFIGHGDDPRIGKGNYAAGFIRRDSHCHGASG